MNYSISSNVLVALTLWLMLALSHASAYDGYGSSNGHNKYGYGPYGPKNHKGKSHKSPKNHRGKNHHGPKTRPTPPTSPSISPTPSSPPPTTRPIGLQIGFYKGLCPNNVDIEAILIKKVQEHFAKDITIVAALLRMQFHDCFVHGCDASILIDGPSSEKTAFPNLSVRGYDLIDILKSIAEAVCPGIVSCSDIIAIATKEVIKLGGGPDYPVQTGRNDGLVSNAADVNLPSPFFSVSESISAFKAKNFTPEEMVVLLGCHTVGTSNCAFFQDRLYEGTGQFDKNMDSNLRRQLIPTCPQGTTSNNVTFLDQNPQSSNKLDNSFYDQILKQRGILSIDQALARDSLTKDFVLRLAQSSALFNSELAKAMVKLQALDVHLGNKGEIRKTCNRFN
ncbi:peroxidase 57-like [Silene latifolia]|uniref:peroxidase 57-like n=1 Tax=Silene latifolia TaxID=37657 RepID=UPI003D78235B